jgi:hypothetical protein
MEVFVIVNRILYGGTNIVGVFASLAVAEDALMRLNDKEDFWDDNLYSIQAYPIQN